MKFMNEPYARASIIVSTRTSLRLAVISAVLVIAAVQAQASSLLNIDFGQNEAPTKVGPAAIGQSPADFWNFYTRDDGAGGWRTFGAMTNLKLADGTVTAAGLTVDNAPGSWGTTSSDPMYANYLYPFSGVATVTMTNLDAGLFDLYVYSHDGNYQLTVGATSYGAKTSRDNSPSGVPVWLEGQQYVRFDGVGIGVGEALTLTVQPGLDGHAIISGLQLVAVPEPSVMALVLGAAFLRVFRNRNRA